MMLHDALLKHDFDERYKVLGWYFDQKIVNLPEKVYATFFKDDKTGKIIIILLNNNEKDLELNLELDWDSLGIKDPLSVKVDDPVFKTKEPKIKDRKLVTPIGKVNMRMIVLEP